MKEGKEKHDISSIVTPFTHWFVPYSFSYSVKFSLNNYHVPGNMISAGELYHEASPQQSTAKTKWPGNHHETLEIQACLLGDDQSLDKDMSFY